MSNVRPNLFDGDGGDRVHAELLLTAWFLGVEMVARATRGAIPWDASEAVQSSRDIARAVIAEFEK